MYIFYRDIVDYLYYNMISEPNFQCQKLKNKNAYWSEGVSIIGDTVYYINKDNLISKNHISLFL